MNASEISNNLGSEGDVCAHENSWSSNCSDCDEAELMDNRLSDPDFEPSTEREGIGW